MTNTTTGTVRINIYVTLTRAEFEAGWKSDDGELEESLAATLHEVIGDDGVPYVPKFFGIDVEDGDDVEYVDRETATA